MAKKKGTLKYHPAVDNNKKNEGDGFRVERGSEPETYGQGDGRDSGGRPDGDPVDHGNEVGAFKLPNDHKDKKYEERMREPKNPALNAVPMPNNTKMNKKDYRTLEYIGDEEGCEAPANNIVGGHMEPNTHRPVKR